MTARSFAPHGEAKVAANDSANERTKRERSPRKFASPFAPTTLLVIANAATQFAIQAWLSYRFAKDVWGIPQPLCIAIIVALDLFAITYMVFTYLLRRAKWTVKLYVWVVFACAVGAQLFAAELYGAHRHWSFELRVFAAIPALALAASLHGYIVVRNHTRDRREAPPVEWKPAAPTVPARQPEASRPIQASPAAPPPKPVREPAPAPARKAVPAGRSARKAAQREDAVRKVLVEKRATAEVAAEIGVHLRSVQGWVQKARETGEIPPAIAAVPTIPIPAKPQVNGHDIRTPVEEEVN